MTVTRTHALNGAALLLAVGACVAIALTDAPTPRAAVDPSAATREVRDAEGTAVPVRAYRRVASLSPIADAILLETIAAWRLVGVSGSMRDGLGPHRFESLHTIDGASVEQVLALDPELVIVSGMSAGGQVAQLRDAGVQVFVMGEMRGIESFLQDARDIARLVGEGQAGEALGERLAQRMRMVAADIPAERRPRGVYLGVIGRGLYGGANHTSYHDVLEAAGLRDAVAHLDSWPELTPEQVLALDPDVVVVHQGTGRQLCERDGLRTLRACRRAGGARVVELPSGLLNDPGLGMLPCAEQLRAIVHGAPTAAPPHEPRQEPRPE
jgi:ABC-type Fe3+-hydroxamate transport system substrate-binding protein